MSGDWVIVADGAQARFMVFGRHTGPRRGELRLVESSKLDNPEHTIRGRRDARQLKSGYDTVNYEYTDHREQHDAELLRRFAARIARQATALSTIGEVTAITLVANPRMMGLLQSAFEPLAKLGISLRTLQRDFTWCTPAQVQHHLGENRLLPVRHEYQPRHSKSPTLASAFH